MEISFFCNNFVEPSMLSLVLGSFSHFLSIKSLKYFGIFSILEFKFLKSFLTSFKIKMFSSLLLILNFQVELQVLNNIVITDQAQNAQPLFYFQIIDE